MNFHILTLFPEMIEQGLNTSITGRAISNGLCRLKQLISGTMRLISIKAWMIIPMVAEPGC